MADQHGADWYTIAGAALGGGGLTQLLSWWTGFRKSKAEIKKTEAEAGQTLEAAVNDRVRTMLDGFKVQIEALQRRLEHQEQDCREREERQEATIQRLEDEIKSLRKALDERPRPGPMPIGI